MSDEKQERSRQYLRSWRSAKCVLKKIDTEHLIDDSHMGNHVDDTENMSSPQSIIASLELEEYLQDDMEVALDDDRGEAYEDDREVYV